MPTHIFTRLGLWQESIQSNLASAAAAKNHVAKTHSGAASFDQLHAMDYLAYAYLQGGQDQKAKGVFDELGQISKLDLENFAAAYAFAAIPARYTLERRRWEEAAKLTLHPRAFPWKQFPYAGAITWFARAVGAARSGDTTAARQDVEKLAAIQQALVQAKDTYWADQVEIQRRAAAAWLALAEGDREKALALMRAAADLEDSTEKHPVTPGSILPAREMLGDLLLETGQPAKALVEFEASLRNAPNRFNGLSGAARAAAASGDRKKAAEYYAQLVKLCEKAEGARPELQKAKAFLAKQ
jgi:tetratricopeptide (TPR) repeat protein